MMLSFYELPVALQIVLMTAQFLAVCFGVCLIPTVFSRQAKLPRLILILGILLSLAMLGAYSSNIRVEKTETVLPPETQWLSQQPVWITALLLLAILAYMVYLLIAEHRRRKGTITRFSIKEGLDSLSSGLCFYEPNGRIILVNSSMCELCHQLVGRDLQNAALFWQLLQDGTVKEGVLRLGEGQQPTFRLPDGTVWSFAREQLGNICQLTAADTTQIQALTARLEEENKHLEVFNQRLRDYGENADALTRAKERLEIKMKVHGMLGQALLATRRYLQDENVDPNAAISLWQHSVAVLHKEAVQETVQPLEALKKAAAATGISLQLKGQIPEDGKVRQLFLRAAAESLTNAISHAKAKTLYVDFARDEYGPRVTIYNDGLLPVGPITEGGGLSALRKEAERIGGQMHIASNPQFILTISFGKGGNCDV